MKKTKNEIQCDRTISIFAMISFIIISFFFIIGKNNKIEELENNIDKLENNIYKYVVNFSSYEFCGGLIECEATSKTLEQRIVDLEERKTKIK